MNNKKVACRFTSHYYFGDKADKILTELSVPHQLMATPPELNMNVWFVHSNRLEYCRTSSDYPKKNIRLVNQALFGMKRGNQF